MISKAIASPAVALLPQVDFGHRLREGLAAVSEFFAAVSTGAEASYAYQRLTARGVPSPVAAQRVLSRI